MTPDRQTLETIATYYNRILAGEDVEKVNAELQFGGGFPANSLWKPVALGKGKVKIEWVDGVRYRFAPRTHTVNGFEVPAPMDKEPKEHDRYYVCDPTQTKLYYLRRSTGSQKDFLLFSRKRCFETPEAAQANALAMMGYDPETTSVEDV